MLQGDILLTFQTTHQALKAENVVASAGYPFDIIPTPRAITASCGLSLEIKSADLAAINKALAQASITPQATYRWIEKDRYERLD